MLTEEEKLDTLAVLGIELNRVQDLDVLMERILTEARRFANADAGSIYVRDNNTLNFSYTQNDTLQAELAPGEKLIYTTCSMPIDDSSIAGYVAASGAPLNLADVYAVDSTKPYHFSRVYDQTSHYTTHSALTVPMKDPDSHVIGVLQMINARDPGGAFIAFTEKDERMMSHFASVAAVALKRAQMTRAMILRMIRMAEMRDPKETGAHVNRVGGYAIELYERWAQKRGHAQKDIDRQRDVFRMAAMLHDVGKIAISDRILKKPGRFDAEEYELMKLHTVYGAQLFTDRQSEYDDAAAQVALRHHERWDGTGYPGDIAVGPGFPATVNIDTTAPPPGIKGEDIPVFARIVSLVDVYDALCSSRVYKDAWDEERVLAVLEENAGRQFDPELVEIFFDRLPVIHSIAGRYQES